MKIKEYIKELLFANQGVILPGLGGFISEYEPASFDVNENKFLPPSKKISFNSDYSFQDSLLTDYISATEKIDVEKAKMFLNDFIKDIQQRLKKGEKIEFPEIGILTQTSKGQILFSQDTESNFLTDSFGLTSIKAKQSIIEPTIYKRPIQKKSYRKYLIFSSLAIVILLLVAGGWYFTQGFQDFKLFTPEKQDLTVQITENNLKEKTERNLDSIAKADSLKALIVYSIDNNTDKRDALFYQESQIKDQTQLKQQYSEFYIIAGSFKKMKNAEKFADELRKKGFNPNIIQSGENLIRISIYTYTNETEALTQLYKLRETSEVKSVWILKSI